MEVQTLTEFINVFHTPPNGDVDKIHDLCMKHIKEVDGTTPLKSAGVQGARVREAWAACVAAEKLGQDVRTKGDVALDLDQMLKESELRTTRSTFWLRHKVSFMPQYSPGDTLLSRLTRECERRNLNMVDMLRVKGAEDEKRARKPLRDIGKGTGLKMETTTDDVVVNRKQNCTDYLFGLSVYLNTLSVVGCVEPKCGVPKDAASNPVIEDEESEPSDFVELPYQFALKYLDRATRYSNMVPVADSFRLLRARDEEERTKWLHEFKRLKSKSLGKVVEKIFQDRDSLWRWEGEEPGAGGHARRRGETDTGGGREKQLQNENKQLRENNARLREGGGRSRRDRSRSPRRLSSESKNRTSQSHSGSKEEAPKGHPVTNAALKNGTVMCPFWNKGRCGKANCPDKHACNGQDKKDPSRTCGGNHTSTVCRTCKRS